MDSIKFENRNVGGTVSKDAINALQSKAAEAVGTIIRSGVQAAMNQFN